MILRVSLWPGMLAGVALPSRQSRSCAAGKKWFTLPSLATTAGQPEPLHVTTTSTKYATGPVVAQLTLRPELAVTLKLRGILSEDNPAHRALLALDDALPAAAAARAAAPDTSRGSVQPARAPAVKREVVDLVADKQPARQRARTALKRDLTWRDLTWPDPWWLPWVLPVPGCCTSDS